MLAALHCELFGRQPERIEAHRVQHVVAGHAHVARVHVGADEAQRVPDVQALAAWIRKHVEDELLRASGEARIVGQWPDRIGRVERGLLVPAVVPARLDFLRKRARVPMRWRIAFGVRASSGVHSLQILRVRVA